MSSEQAQILTQPGQEGRPHQPQKGNITMFETQVLPDLLMVTGVSEVEDAVACELHLFQGQGQALTPNALVGGLQRQTFGQRGPPWRLFSPPPPAQRKVHKHRNGRQTQKGPLSAGPRKPEVRAYRVGTGRGVVRRDDPHPH